MNFHQVILFPFKKYDDQLDRFEVLYTKTSLHNMKIHQLFSRSLVLQSHHLEGLISYISSKFKMILISPQSWIFFI